VLALVGKSGSGKTTLLKCVYGLEDLWEGEITLENNKVLGPAWNLMPGSPDMKLVTQEYYVLENHTVSENVHDRLSGYSDAEKDKRTKRMLKLLELEPLAGMRARQLSSGQRQRVAIARALADMPKVLLLDEPFSNLDKLLSEKLFAFIGREARRKRTAVVLITHVPEEALKHADTVAVMHEGRVVQQGDIWQVYYNPKNLRLAGLLGDYSVLHGEDFISKSAYRKKSRTFIRPDKLVATTTGKGDVQLTVTGCTFNGKCHELLCESSSGRAAIVYSSKPVAAGVRQDFRLLI
jgi:iron(III) transport system ATP-binding protein